MERRMFQRIITAIVLAAVITIALVSGALAMAAAPSDGVGSLSDPVGGHTCTLDTAFGSIPCPDLNWNLGGLSSFQAKIVNQRGQ